MLKFKPVLSRKLVLSITAGALVTASVIGAGTFAWFTYTGKTTLEASFYTGTMSDIKFEENEANMYNFYPGHVPSKDAMAGLEASLNSVYNAPEKNKAFEGWIDEYLDDFKIYAVNEVPTNDLGTDTVALITNPFEKSATLGETQRFWQLTPGSLIEAGFHMDAGNHTSAPIYFRVKPATLKAFMDDENKAEAWWSGLQQAMTATIQLKTSEKSGNEVTLVDLETELKAGPNGYYYCSVPLMSGAVGNNGISYEVSQADIKLYAYVSGQNTLDGLEKTFIKFDGNNEIDFIQATNNAIYFEDGWKDVVAADTEFFVPYVNADIYATYLENWGYTVNP